MKYTNDTIARIRGAIAAGVNMKSIGKHLGIPRGGMHSLIYNRQRGKDEPPNREIDALIGAWLKQGK